MKSMSPEILIVAASRLELSVLQQKTSEVVVLSDQLERWTIASQSFDVLITGVGMVATSYHLGVQLHVKKYDLLINAGIAGSFDFSLSLGAVFQIKEDCFADIGAEDDDKFLSLDELKLGKTAYTAYGNLQLDIATATAVTVNTVHGNKANITAFQSRLNGSLESMEGAAVFYVCEAAKQKVVQIRSISNYVETRNRNAWEIPLAIKNLNECLYHMIPNVEGILKKQQQ